MLNGMNTDQMYVVDAFLILYRASFVFPLSFLLLFMAPVLGLVECDGNGFFAFDISCMNSWVLLNAPLFSRGGKKKKASLWS